MLRQSSGPVKPSEGYQPGSLDAVVRAFALRYWPDASQDDNWQTFRTYYGRQFIGQMRADVAAGRAS